MPTRKDIFINCREFHIFDRTLEDHDIFNDLKIWEMFLGAVKYYSYYIKVSFSDYRRMKENDRHVIVKHEMIKANKLVDIEYHMGMPNHYHFILKQLQDNGVIHCMSRALNSITRYYNRRHKRKGPIFLPQFRSVAILSAEQLVRTSGYIHLNPWKSGLVSSLQGLINYPTSSLGIYVGVKGSTWLRTEPVMRHFHYSGIEYKKYLIGKGISE
ncbi:hypothetical protein A3B02_00950 [Candidatus Roizmanbacteria bacterium RIFCSPLOWO2_01_FULL_42_14]|uniref:Transposase IS200-like domain-containing protein n=3 Tax=Candidatus Roizmaniibacteriota TaxID=1752723 RepID=A0A1F7JTD8_9BACT|nr:MAG: hypothetical protein A3B02_00950 [Candidatus Roizmanbacteria bacterium RIFCSPLOWO2_01_FULL_42_14]OGK58876.1 MAG: hypothetical protein A3I56_04450 [Candidatus Roizmanbacteria bacterium RIFCSPLOWO2_02_FULL_43_10]